MIDYFLLTIFICVFKSSSFPCCQHFWHLRPGRVVSEPLRLAAGETWQSSDPIGPPAPPVLTQTPPPGIDKVGDLSPLPPSLHEAFAHGHCRPFGTFGKLHRVQKWPEIDKHLLYVRTYFSNTCCFDTELYCHYPITQ